MSTTVEPPPLPPPSSPPFSFSHSLTSLGLGYSIAIALAFLVLFSTLLLSSYLCCKAHRRRRYRNSNNHHRHNSTSFDPSGTNSTTTTYLPRIIFVSEEDDESNNPSSQNVVVGLEQAVINSYPKFSYKKGQRQHNCDGVCAICLCEYRESEVLRMLPDCRHSFHVMCVDAWLKLNASCPVCRNSPLPTPISTPLQEVVPLSQYADGRRRG